MRRRGKGTDLRNQTFKSDARTLAHKALASSSEIEIQDPDTGAIRYYLELGFTFDTAGRLVISVGAP
jgi:hypothetical protein